MNVDCYNSPDFMKREMSLGTQDRPDFGPTHVRTVDKLVVGQTYLLHGVIPGMTDHDGRPIEYSQDYTILDLPHTPGGRIRVRTTEYPDPNIVEPVALEKNASQAELALAPDPQTGWSQTNWLEDPAKSQTA